MKNKKGFSNINWAEKLAEIAVVVIGISLAFFVDRSYEAFKNRQTVEMYLKSLHQDVQSDLQQLDSLLLLLSKKDQKLQWMVDAWTEQWFNDDSLMLAINLVSNLNFFEMQVTTFRSLQSSGEINLLRDFRLRRSLFDYYRQGEGLKILHQMLQNFFNRFIIPLLLEKVDMRNGKILDQRFFKSAKFRNRIVGFWSLEKQLADFYSSLNRKAKILKQMIEQQL